MEPMAADARCRCGNRLRFRRGEAGYKTRCPACHALVRLRKADRQNERTEQVSVSEQTPAPTKPPPPLPPLPSFAAYETAPLPVVEMTPLTPLAPTPARIRVWRWPVWLT